MLRFIVRRLLIGVVTITAISIITFLLFFAVPSSPAKVMCGKNCTANDIAAVETRLGIRDPIHEQYLNYVKGVFVGRTYAEGTDFETRCDAPCLGYSFRNQEPITAIVGRTLPVTLSIVFGGAVVYLLLGIALGMISALRRGTAFDKFAIGTSLVGASMQIYSFGLLLLAILVYATGWVSFPTYVPLTENPLAWAQGLILPWLTLGFLNSAVYARMSRAQMLETLSEDFVRTARAKGLPKRKVYTKHALRAAITPVVTLAGLDIGAQLGGTFITETVFGLQGLGKATVDAVQFLNLPLVVATVLIAAVFVVIANLVVDVLYAVIDPRVRLA